MMSIMTGMPEQKDRNEIRNGTGTPAMLAKQGRERPDGAGSHRSADRSGNENRVRGPLFPGLDPWSEYQLSIFLICRAFWYGLTP